MLYCVEKASRLNFVAEMRSTKLVADIQQAASEAEASGEKSACSGWSLTLWIATSLPSHQPLCQACNGIKSV